MSGKNPEKFGGAASADFGKWGAKRV